MTKKVLSGFLAAALVTGSIVAATPNTAEAAKAPKANYTFNMDKANKNVVAVARKGDTSNFTVDVNKKGNEGGVMPSASQAKKVKLKYVKGKNGKALYLDRSSSYGAQLKGVNLGSGSWTISFWVQPEQSLSNFMPVFFTCSSNATDAKNTKWLSITHREDIGTDGDPLIWSHSISGGKNEQFPWFCYQNEDGEWVQKMALGAKKWTHITLVVDTKDTCEYGTKGDEGYVKSYHAWTYVDGKLYGNGTVAKGTMSSKNNFFLGINCWDTPFKGYFDDVMLWKKALTGKQVAALYKSVK